MASTGAPNALSVGRAKSCTSCRQVKLACDVRQTFPSPCSRCVTRKRECKIDASFKRFPARKQLEDVKNQLNELRAAVALDRRVTPEILGSRKGSSTGAQTEPSENDPAAASPPSDDADGGPRPFKWLQLDENTQMESFSLELVSLLPQTVIELLNHFEKYYFPHLPIFEQVKSVEQLLESSPLLFWTIILVSSQWHPTLSHLYEEIVAPHENLLGLIVRRAIHSIHTVGALLILCLWPVPKLHQSQDPSWNYISLAMSAAMQLGIHQPLSLSEVSSGYIIWGTLPRKRISHRVQSLTWLSSFNINVQIGNFLGLPPQFCSTTQLSQITRIVREAKAVIPRSFAARTEIQQQTARYISQLTGIVDSQTYMSLVHVFDSELDVIRTAYQDAWSPELELNLLAAKLYLYGLYFTTDSPFPAKDLLTGKSPPSYRMIMHLGLAAASSLISIMSSLHSAPSPSTPPAITQSPHVTDGSSHLLFYPKPYFTSAFYATIFLLKFLSTQPDASQLDRQSAINHITTAHQLFNAFGAGRDHKRAALLIEVLGRMTRSNIGTGVPSITIRSRLGASLIYDATWVAALYRKGKLGEDPTLQEQSQQQPSRGKQREDRDDPGVTTEEVAPPGNVQALGWLTLDERNHLPPAPEQLPSYKRTLSSSASGSGSVSGPTGGGGEVGQSPRTNMMAAASATTLYPQHHLDQQQLGDEVNLSMDLEQGWTWGMWDNELYDELAVAGVSMGDVGVGLDSSFGAGGGGIGPEMGMEYDMDPSPGSF